MSTILIAGDSWGIGVFSGTGDNYGPVGIGIHSILQNYGHTVINISKGGGSNWLMMDRLDQKWYNTGSCILGATDPQIKFDLLTVDYIIFLQTDIFRERHYYVKQFPTDKETRWKMLEQEFVDSIQSYMTLDAYIDHYFTKLYNKLNSYGKPVLCVGGWCQLHPKINQYNNLIAAVSSATKLLIPELNCDTYLSDPEWYIQLANDSKFMEKFGNQFKPMSIQNADKLSLIYQHWNEVHPDIYGYQKIVDQLLPYFG